jgi:hypothetical protein
MNNIYTHRPNPLHPKRLCCSIDSLRRLLAILLAALFTLPFVTPLLAQSREANLPACCRRAGAHHCQMAAIPTTGTHLLAHNSCCPLYPRAITSTHPNPLANPAAQTDLTPVNTRPNAIPQTESRRRIARERTRQKRGPPTFLS